MTKKKGQRERRRRKQLATTEHGKLVGEEL